MSSWQAEIHMTYNLLEVCLHNAFDYGLNTNPREPSLFFAASLILYPHLFSHSLAAELTVRHLIIEGAVFNQIWAMTYDSMLNYLQKTYNTFSYGFDEDYEGRKHILEDLLAKQPDMGLGPNRPGLDFNCSLIWAEQYFDIFHEYTKSMVDSIYETEDRLKNDGHMAEFWESITRLFATIPDRYDKLQTKAGLSRFLADTICHLSVGHEFYGTTAVSGAADPRIVTVSRSAQLPLPISFDLSKLFLFCRHKFLRMVALLVSTNGALSRLFRLLLPTSTFVLFFRIPRTLFRTAAEHSLKFSTMLPP